ncbi:HABP4_PAI-RBP1 domain-containing protein, partial [Haematococcus lacustris]
MPSQEISLEEYEKQLLEKKAALNKVAEVKAVSLDDFKGMKTYARKEVDEEVPGLELLVKKKDAKAKEDTAKDKPKKQTISTLTLASFTYIHIFVPT